MTYEFKAKTEREAIDLAVKELGLEKDQFDVEIIEIQKSSLFKRGFAKIRVHIDENVCKKFPSKTEVPEEEEEDNSILQNEIASTENDIKNFLEELITKMGYTASVEAVKTDSRRLAFRISTNNSPIIIGKHGKNLEAIQLLANVYSGKIGLTSSRVFVDCENYRLHREESLVKLAYETADKVSLSKKSILLEPMNPYERRLIHTALNDIHDVETKSEGTGLYKRVRISYR